MKRLFSLVLALAIALTTVGSAFANSNSSSSNASVYVIHGINGRDLGLPASSLPVDVSVNGGCALKGFTFGQIVGPLSLPAGTYAIAISLANASNPCSNAVVISANVPFTAGESSTVIAHLSAAGAPTASKFVNDLSNPGFLKGRVSVRHTAAAPAVDVKVNFGLRNIATIEDLTNGNKADASLFFSFYNASVFVANTDTRVLGPASFFSLPNRLTMIYAVGSASNGTLQLIRHTIRTR